MTLRVKNVALWGALIAAVSLPVVAASQSPLLQWRDPTYIAAGFAGILAVCLLLVQPLLVGGLLPGLPLARARKLHGWIGVGLILAVMAHVVGLWITSPPDVLDALMFASPTPFSVWGVIAMWAIFIAAGLAALRRRIGLRRFRLGHTGLVLVVVIGTVGHALLIEGTMEVMTKIALCLCVVIATVKTVADLRVWVLVRRREP